MLKKRYLETGAAVKPEANMPNDQTEDEGSQFRRRTMKVNTQNLPKNGDTHPLTFCLVIIDSCRMVCTYVLYKFPSRA